MAIDHLQYLKNIDLFESFSEEELGRIALEVREVRHQAGDTLFAEGETGKEMFILLEGLLKVWKENRLIATLLPIDYIGEMAIIENKPRSATVQVSAPSLLLKISSEDFQKYLVEQPQSLVSMMRNLSQRIRRDTEMIAAEFEKANIMIHDMRNMLSTFLYLNALEKKNVDEETTKWCGFMQQARKNLVSMVEEAMAHAKRLHYNNTFEKGCLESLLAELTEMEFSVHPDLAGRNITIRVNRTPPAFLFSKLGIRRAVFNLVLNAAQASPSGSCLEIELDHEEGQAIVRVKDEGDGIPSHLEDKIFEPRFTTRQEGNGLGLASCRQIIVNDHCGTLFHQPAQKKGTIFTFTLPLRAPAENPPEKN
jgi:two-component system, sporulation sensor kinase D